MRYYIPKEGVIMAEALGQELLIDLYSCDEDAIHPLIKLCTQILSDDPLFFLVNSYTTDWHRLF